jgi:hypothetical protein
VGAPPCPVSEDSASEGELGVAECDSYISKYRTCVRTKISSPNTRKQLESALERTLEIWRRTDKDKLRIACRSAAQSARRAFRSFGCDF